MPVNDTMDTIFENILAILIAGIWVFSAIHSRNKAKREQSGRNGAPTPATEPLPNPYPVRKQNTERQHAERAPHAGQHEERNVMEMRPDTSDARHTGHMKDNSGMPGDRSGKTSETASPAEKHGSRIQNQQSDDVTETFDLRKAVIYSEILNPKFKEEE